LADIVLFAKPEFDNGEAEYGFYTKNFQILFICRVNLSDF